MSPADRSDAELRELCCQLNSPDAFLRSDAHARLRTLGDDPALALLDFVNAERSRYFTRRKRAKFQEFWLSILPFFVITIGTMYASFNGKWLGLYIGVFSALVFTSVGIRLRLKHACPPTALTAAYALLAERGEPRLLPALVDALRTDEGTTLSNAEILMMRVLSKLSHRDWQQFSPKACDGFLRRLTQRAVSLHWFNAQFALAGLKALEQSGDTEAIAAVETIAKRGRNRMVREAAKECLIALEVRRDAWVISQTLLRAASYDGQENELLRAAVSTESRSDELLRIPHA